MSDVQQNFLDIKDSKWRMTGIEQFPTRLLNALESGVEKIANNLGLNLLVADYEVIGSYACNTADTVSDIDINLAAIDWASQNTMNALLPHESGVPNPNVRRFAQELANELRIQIQIIHTNPDCKTYMPTYSLKSRRLFGRTAGEIVNEHRKWNPTSKRWELATKPQRIFQADPRFL